MLNRPPLRIRRALRTALLLTVAGCDAGATFGGCWMPQITFSGLDAGAQTQTTSATVAAAPRTDDRATTDQVGSSDDRPSTSDAPSNGATKPLYNRIPAFPDPPPPAPPAPQSTIVYYVPTTGAGAPAAQAPQQPQQGAAGEVSSEGAPSGDAPPSEVVAIPLDVDSRRIAPEGSSVAGPGVRPPPLPGYPAPPSQVAEEPTPPLPSMVPGPRPQPAPMNFRVPPPPPPGPPIP